MCYVMNSQNSAVLVTLEEKSVASQNGQRQNAMSREDVSWAIPKELARVRYTTNMCVMCQNHYKSVANYDKAKSVFN